MSPSPFTQVADLGLLLYLNGCHGVVSVSAV